MINKNLPQPQDMFVLPEKTELAIVENFEESLEEVYKETKSLDSWSPYESLPVLQKGSNYSKCLNILDRFLTPASEKEAKISIIEMVKTCFALGWASVDSDFKIFGKIYYETLSHLPLNFLKETLSNALKTWSHGQYCKMPSPAFLTECIPDSYHELKHKRSRIDFAKYIENKSLKSKQLQNSSVKKVDVSLTFLKKVEAYEDD